MFADFTNPEYKNSSSKFNIGINEKKSNIENSAIKEKSSIKSKLNSLFSKKKSKSSINNKKDDLEPKTENIVEKKQLDSKNFTTDNINKNSINNKPQDTIKQADSGDDNSVQLLSLDELIDMAPKAKKEPAIKEEKVNVEENPVKQRLDDIFRRLNENKAKFYQKEDKDNKSSINTQDSNEVTTNSIDVFEDIDNTKTENIDIYDSKNTLDQEDTFLKNSIEQNIDTNSNSDDLEDKFLDNNFKNETKEKDNSDDDFLANFVNSPVQENIDTQPQTVAKKSIDDYMVNYDKFNFTANASEYFRIWIVNVFLSIITLGIYSAWAKVRTNQYFYANTYIGGSNFEYNANPKRILAGRVIVAMFYVAFIVFANILNIPIVSVSIFALFVVLLPWIIKQAVRFRLKSTSYRNIHFRFEGKTVDFYKLYIGAFLVVAAPYIAIVIFSLFGINMLPKIGVVVGVIALIVLYLVLLFFVVPVFYKKNKELIINNSYFGKDKFNFSAKKRNIVKIFTKIFIVSAIVLALFGGVSSFANSYFGINLAQKNSTMVLLASVLSVLYIGAIAFTKGYSDAHLSNFTRNHTTLRDIKFKGTINPFKLGFISSTNALAIIFSLGLLYPWAKVRYLRYKMQNTLCASKDYDSFIESSIDDTSAIGEESVDLFDIDIGI